MKKVMVFVAMIVVAGLNIANAQVNWQLKKEGNGTAPATGGNEHYLLLNTSLNQGIEYGKRLVGINLEWSGGNVVKNKWWIVIKRQPGATGPIKTGEKVAIRFDGGGYLKWENRDAGVNLGWVSKDVAEDKIPYEWELRTSVNQMDIPLNTNTSFALFNHTNKTFLVYCKRGSTGGVNLGWSNSCEGCDYTATERLIDKAKSKIPNDVKDILSRVKDATDLTTWGCK
ncbi:MAG: hypothetical protein IPM69_05965 [Ignavibacteria bacterium]|nr:hypothetical protein [Ignavibacteria bacterium]